LAAVINFDTEGGAPPMMDVFDPADSGISLDLDDGDGAQGLACQC
jgi:hypothetical protein